MKLSIIVPCFNEEKTISKVLDWLLVLKYPEWVTGSEIIVINDCSTDNTKEIVSRYEQNYTNVTLINHEVNKGKGQGIISGLEKVTGDYVLFQDGDLELCPDDIPVMLVELRKNNAKFINGSRYLPGIARPLGSYKRYIANKLFTILTSLVTDIHTTDMACGYKLVQTELLKKLTIEQKGFGIEAEIFIKASKELNNPNDFVEVPVHYFPRTEKEGKKIRNIDGFKILWTILKYSIFSNFKTSKNLFFLFPIITFICFTSFGLWKSDSAISWDVIHYYEYLPATFIEFDWTFAFRNAESIPDKVLLVQAPNGGLIPKTSMGMSILYFPYFFVAHVFSLLFGWEINHGYAHQYQYAVGISGLIHGMIGLFFLRKFLIQYFSELTTFLTLVAVYFGTNLFFYTFKEGGMTHEHTFMLSTILLYFFPKWLQNPDWKLSVLLGFTVGIMVLIRPINVLFLLIPMFYQVHSIPSFLGNLKKVIISNRLYLLMMFITAVIVWIPQIIFWKTITGHFFFYSYQGERFFFDDPKIIESLFGFRKGLFIYFPVMVFSFLGFIFLKKYVKDWNFAVLFFVFVNIYIVTSWWCWWYGGSFGYRAFIDMFAILALPLAAFIQNSLHSNNRIKMSLLSFYAFFIYLGIFHTYQFNKGIIHHDSMTFESYKSVFLKTSTPAHFDSLLDPPNYDKALKGER